MKDITIILKKISRDEIKAIYPYIAKAEYHIKSSGTSRALVNNPVFVLSSEILSPQPSGAQS